MKEKEPTAELVVVDVKRYKKIKNALSDSEARYRLLFENMTEGVAVHEIIYDKKGKAVDYRILDVNRAYEKYMGISFEKAVGSLASELYGIKSPPYIEEYTAVVRSGKPFSFETYFRQYDQHFSISVFLAKPDQFVTVFRDIGERKRLESQKETALTALKESEEKYRMVVTNVRDIIYIFNADGSVDFIGPQVSAYGYAPEDVIGHNIMEFIHADDQAAMLSDLKKTMASGESFPSVCRLKCKNGEYIYIEEVGSVIAEDGKSPVVIGTLRNISERKQIEAQKEAALEALRESENLHRNLMEKLPAGIIIIDPLTRMIESVNARAEAMFGGAAAEIVGNRCHSFVCPAEEKNCPVLDLDQEVDDSERVLLHADGSRHPILKSVTRIKWRGREKLLECFVDISERKKAESQKEAALKEVRQKALELREKNEELERFTNSVSHDLKSPLVTILTFLGHLEQDMVAENKDKIKRDIGYIRNGAEKMSRLLDELHKLSRIGRIANPAEDLSWQMIVKEALDLVAGRISKRGVKVVVAAAELMLCGDRPRLIEIFQNLLDNACKFMGEQKAPLVEIGVENKDGEAIIFVRDNGMGIEPQFLARPFIMFAKFDRNTEGDGIGLALVKRIVEVHGGRIWVESAGPGQGACFKFTLPGKRSEFGVKNKKFGVGRSEFGVKREE